MYKIYLPLVATLLISLISTAQNGPLVSWQKCFGGSGNEKAYSIVHGPAGSFVIAGSTTSTNGDVTGHHGAAGTTDAWVISVSYDGRLQWQKSLGGSGADELDRIIATSDGGYIGIGTTTSSDGDVTGFHGSGNNDIWVVKLDSAGNILWERALGGSSQELAGSIIQTPDSGYMVIGSTSSNDGDVSGNHSSTSYDAWVVKLNSTGSVLWQKCYGNTLTDMGYDIAPMANGEFMLGIEGDGGGTGDYTGVSSSNSPNSFLFKIGATGNLIKVVWLQQRSYTYGILPVNSNQYNVLQNVINCYPATPDNEISISNCDSNLTLHSYAASFGYCPITTSSPIGYQTIGSGGLALLSNGTGVGAGTTSDSNHIPMHGNTDGFLFNFGANTWKKCYGGAGYDYFSGIVTNDDFTYIAAGYTNSTDGDVSGNHGGYDFWIVKLSNFNAIKGTVFLDYNSNGVKDANEPLVNNLVVRSTKGGSSSGSLTNNGIFNNAVDTGTYTTSVVSTITNYTVTPASHSTTFTTYDNTDSTSFAFQPVSGRRDYQLTGYSYYSTRPGDTVTVRLSYVNLGTDTLQNRIIQFVRDARTSYLSASVTPTSVSGDTLRWNIVSLSPRDTGYITVSLKLGIPPTLNFGDTLVFSGNIDTTGDINPQNNSFQWKRAVNSSFDPNGKIESNEGYVLAPDLANGKALEYTIFFQNTGNDTAFTVRIMDTLSTKLDATSLQMVASSHPYTLTVTNGNILTWTFTSIKLPDSTVNERGSQGFVVFRIRPTASVGAGDSINNTAGIYFDYNLPVATNLQRTYVSSLPRPVAPQIGGLNAGYCSNGGDKTVSVLNMPAAGSGITVTSTLDGRAVTVAGTGSIVLPVSTLSIGTHSLAVIFTNAGGADTTTAGFQIDAAVTPVVKLTSNPNIISASTLAVVLTATDAAGGGGAPLYTFATDAGFSQLIRAEGQSNTLSLTISSLVTGRNVFYVRMRTSDTCYTAPTAIDSIVLTRIGDTTVVTPPPPADSSGSQPTDTTSSQKITIGPNPFTGSLTITGLNPANSYSISLVNTNGQELIRVMVVGQRQSVLLTGTLQRGFYFLTINDARTGGRIKTIGVLSATK